MSTRLTDHDENIAPPAVLPFSDQTFFYSLDATDTATLPIPEGAGFAAITATNFIGVVNGAAIAMPSDPSGFAGYQEVEFSESITSGTATGLANNSTIYTATVTVDGTPIAIQITGSAAQTYGTLVSQLNTDLGVAATASITGGKLRITSASTGSSSTVFITNAQIITPTPTASATVTLTPTRTPTISATPSISPTTTVSPTISRTPSVTPSVTDSPGITPSASATPTLTTTPTPTLTATNSPTVTPTISATPSVSPTISVTPSVTGTITVTPSRTPTITLTPSSTPTITVSPSPYASGLFNSLTLFVQFLTPVNGGYTPNNMEVVLTIVKRIAPNQTQLGLTGFTNGTMVSVSFYIS